MYKLARIRRQFALAAAGAGALMIAMLVAPAPAKARMMTGASIIGPATVEDGVLCTWDSSTSFEGSASYEWTLSNDSGTSVVSTAPYVSLVLNKSLGTHQGLN